MCFVAVRKTSNLVKVVVLGDVNVGKTSLVRRFVNGTSPTPGYRSPIPTLGADLFVQEVQITDGTTVKAQFWDTAGQERYWSLSAAYYRNADCCVLVFDATEPATFESISDWRDRFLREADVREPTFFPFVVLGNKVDQVDHINPRNMFFRRVIRWCQDNNGSVYFHTSAEDGTRVDDAFKKIVQYAYDYNKKISSGAVEDDSDRRSIISLPVHPKTNPEMVNNSNKGCC